MSEQESSIREQLKEVIDPELMINIVDLGLVYDVVYNGIEKKIKIDLTLTSRGCPLGDMIIDHARMLLMAKHPGFEINVNLIWEPPWTPDMLSPEGKTALGRN